MDPASTEFALITFEASFDPRRRSDPEEQHCLIANHPPNLSQHDLYPNRKFLLAVA